MNFFKRALFKLIGLFYPCKYIGLENIPKESCILICNHFSCIDPVFLAKTDMKSDYSFVAKKELFNNKFFGFILKKFGAIPIDRQKPDFKSLYTILKSIKSGNKLIIFPEGTRNKTGTDELLPLKDGVSIFSIKAKCEICPLIILKKAKLFKKTKILIGKPFDFSEYYDKKLDQETLLELNSVIRNKLIDLQNKIKDNKCKF